ncbi:glycosyltransferase family 15 protein [Phanerochaete carnosa HHB-10118-sp]|uniref:Glycosyltransferase family 15 protein n=1 Tax=Phanerochaete carnosa (strain HHB-10118-sp) TaxID=650164 RepID=K5W6P0_PHACS|nr:glycosyltransferase family 15 protein [Phanerochaete carnosa HHB-10118-sp]EKM54624.1 glycosyltransferase family 15 protein [Phanerochaete carnosa HHB-10118-sp]
MNTTTRYVILVLVVVLGLHSILSFTHEDYGRATSLSKISSKLSFNGDSEDIDDLPPPSGRRANATILMLTRNSDTEAAIRSVRDLEDRFNHKFQYPWVFLNDEPFSDEFKRRVSNVISGPVEFGVVPQDHWQQPDWIDEEKASASREKMVQDNIIYGGSVSYRNMCRFNSGFFYKHPIVQKYKWYWRVEPDVHFHCDINGDPFVFMEDNNKVYGFTITMYEFQATIPTLWNTVKEFTAEYPQYVAKDNAMGYLSDDGGNSFLHAPVGTHSLNNMSLIYSTSRLNDLSASCTRDGLSAANALSKITRVRLYYQIIYPDTFTATTLRRRHEFVI